MRKLKSEKEKREDADIRLIIGAFERSGVQIRREKLARGFDFRVKSGVCVLTKQPVVFVDKRLPFEHQLSILFDYLELYDIRLSVAETNSLNSIP